MNRTEREDSFVAFATARRPALRRMAYALCGDWHRADDLVQTALTRLYVAWPRITREGREDAYVRRIIVRANLDEHRRPWRRERPGLDGVPTAAAREMDPADRSALFEALQALPVMQRRTVVLRHLVGLSVEETADELGIAAGTVKSHTSRALTALGLELAADR